MESQLRILIVEDQPDDAELAIREIRKFINHSEFLHVDTRKKFLDALVNFQPDLIVSDYEMPSFDGLSVIKLTLKNAPLTPVVILTGAIDEETAAESVKAGAVDYVIKGNIIRLKQAVQHALEKKQMWQEQIDADERLRVSEERYRLISSVTSDYLFSTVVTPENKLELNWVAGAFEKISGYSIEEYKARGGWRSTLHPDDIEIDNRDFEKMLTNQKVVTEVRTIKKDGEVMWVSVYATPVWDDKENRLVGIYGAVQDINIRKKAEAEINNINLHLNELVKARTKDLEALNKTKDKFFSIIAHDLKGPVAVIIASTEMMLRTLESKPDDKDLLKKYSENILRSTQEGYKLLENLLDWARTQTGAIQYDPQQMDLVACVKESLATLKLIITNKNITVHYPTKAVNVYADNNMAGVVLRNLLSNSIKYSHPGGSISIAFEKKADQVVTTITDHGIGMSKETLSSLFLLEKKNSTPGTGNEKGTGLGLILCKEFIDKLGGKIWVKSEEGVGSSFSFSLPASL